MPGEETVVETAADAAAEVIFSRYRRSTVTDYDVTVTFEDEVLSVDVYLDVPETSDVDPDAVAEEAALAAQSAVDELFESA